MTSAVGKGDGGSPKSRRKEQGCVSSVCDKEGRRSKNPKIVGTSYMEAPLHIRLMRINMSKFFHVEN